VTVKEEIGMVKDENRKPPAPPPPAPFDPPLPPPATTKASTAIELFATLKAAVEVNLR
jgi:hypothetical protein